METNMSEEKQPNRPTHGIYQVTGEGDKARWLKIGAAWLHSDTMPLKGRIVVRELTEKEAASETADNGGQQ
jgi:hypothetical protein